MLRVNKGWDEIEGIEEEEEEENRDISFDKM